MSAALTICGACLLVVVGMSCFEVLVVVGVVSMLRAVVPLWVHRKAQER